MTTQSARARLFNALHVRGNPLVLFNIWDAGSAVAVRDSGAKAIATGSWSVAAAHGYEDGEKLPFDLVLANLHRISDSVDLPVTFDLEGGYGRHPAQVDANVAGVIEAGAVGINLEDQIVGDEGLYLIDDQCARIAGARAAADRAAIPIFINARTDIFLKTSSAHHDERHLEEAARRSVAYAQAGASGFFAPGLRSSEAIGKLCEMSPIPVNIMAAPDVPTRSQLATLGVARISHGPYPYRQMMNALKEAARNALGLAALTQAVVALAALPVAAQRQPAIADRPNVVLIITDDVGYGDIGSYGARDIRTPNIDRLARQGVRLTDFYAAPQCTPTRAALITGRYQQRVRLERALGSAGASLDQGLVATGRSLPQLLKNSGYATGLIGKWHLGYKPEYGPNAHGFDYFYGFLSGYVDFYTHTRGSDGLVDLFENTVPVADSGYMTDLITARAVRFVEQNAARPFFLEVAYNAAHWPFQPPDRHSRAENNGAFQGPGDSVPATRKEYIAMLERADVGVGQILAALERRGLTRNTLVIFTNDNGGEWLSNNAPLFHRKDTLWEGGIRVPAIFRWPARLAAGQTSAQPGITMDLTVSILAATKTPVPDGAALEGSNLLPLLERRAPLVERALFWRIDSPIRQQRAVRKGDWKLLIDGDDLLLFNLRADIGERRDLARHRPDLVRALRRLIADWEKDVDAEAATRSR